MKKNFSSLPFEDKLLNKIHAYYQTIWYEKWKADGDTDLTKEWLDNFNDMSDETARNSEKINMLYLLSQFMYFGNKEMRQLLVSLYRDLYKYPIIYKIRKENNDTLDFAYLNSEFQKELAKTRFLGVGNPSESGVHLLYYFRQECELSKEQFLYPGNIFKTEIVNEVDKDGTKRNYLEATIADNNIKRYVFIDDFCGSGSQAKNYLSKIVQNIKFKDPSIQVSYLMLFSTDYGLQNIKNLNIFDQVESVFCLDKSFKIFSNDSRYYKNETNDLIDINHTKQIVEKYGNRISSCPLGYSDCQLMLSMYHNTPDNTLPIFWSTFKNWKPIFRRYNKIY